MYEEQKLTYQQLNERANQLAHYLRSLGVGPDTLVAIAVERSLEMIVGLLGILKAGGAYVPLDCDYPQERLQFMLNDTNAPVLITQSPLQEKLSEILSSYLGETVLIDKIDQILQQQNPNNPTPLTLPHHLAYVIYTSGSTGKPKGVLIDHRNVIKLVKNTNYVKILPNDNVAQLSNLSFDATTFETWGPLLNGAKLVTIKKLDLLSFDVLANKIIKLKITTQWLTSSLFNQIIKTHAGALSAIKYLLIGGESLDLISFQKFFNEISSHYENFLINGYGPTECTTFSATFNISSKVLEKGSIPIGRPISNTQVYILDVYMNAVPVGVSGEIYIGGAGLARGYLNRPDLTAEKFIPNPFINEEDVREDNRNGKSLRLYRTGDLARYLPDGNIEFLGRIDDQVKIRGFRIELGEIESTLTQHGDVNQAVVVAREEEPGHKQLVAYVVPQERLLSSLDKETLLTSSDQQEFSLLQGQNIPALTEDLRNHLGRSLPDYMIPSFFVFIDKVPLTPNGKIDRKALPAPDLSSRHLGDEYVAPQTPLEQQLCAIWTEVLKIEKISIHDNFFRIGGDSIVSIQLVAKARSRGIHIAVKDVFNQPTIATLALVAQNQEANLTFKADQNLIKGEIPLTPIQHCFFELDLKNKHHYNQATLLQVHGSVDPALLRRTVEMLISHHDVLRCRYIHDITGIWKQNNLEHEDTASIWSIIDFSSVHNQDLALQIEQQANLLQQSLDIEKGPPLKVALFECGKERPACLLIVIHHLVVDGVSWRILLEDLEYTYQFLKEGETPSLPSKTHSYQQWAQALTTYAQSEEIQQQIPYWQTIEQLIQPLPIEFDKGPNTSSSTHTIVLSLTQEETTALLQKVPKAYRTQINDILLTALTLAIGDWTQDYSLSLALEGHGREEDIIKDINLSRTIGWFTSIFPVHLKIENPEDLAGAIKTVKETLRQLPNKGIGYGILKYLTPKSPLSSPLHPTLIFNYLGQWDNTLSQQGLFSASQESAKYNTLTELNSSPYFLNISCEVRNRVLSLSWNYSTNHYKLETMVTIAENFANRLRQVVWQGLYILTSN